MAEVFSMAPKTVTKIYRGDKITITFDPQDKVWRWHVVHHQEHVFDGQEKKLDDAIKAGCKKVDKIMGD